MADEQLSIRLEALAESVRTSMTVDEAEESLSELTELIQKCWQDEGRVHELAGQVFRALLPAFVMTDADFKTPGSLNQPTKAMHAVKQACVAWVLSLTKLVPSLLIPELTNRTEYYRRMRMATNTQEEDWDDENAPPSDDENQPKKSKKIVENSEISLDPILSLFQRFAVRCPDKSEWRRAVIGDVLGAIVKQLHTDAVVGRFLEFLKNLILSDKAAWRVWGLEALSQIGGPADIQVVLARTRDTVPGVRCAAMKAAANLATTDMEPICEMFVKLSRDDKPSVRRAAVSVFDQIVTSVGLTQELASVLATLTMDESLMVRKACVNSIASISSSLPLWASLWCNSVLPLITDVEATVVEKVVESFEQCLLVPLTHANTADSVLPILKAMGENWESGEYAKRALRLVIRKGDAKFNRQVLVGISRMLINADPTLWALLDELASSGLTLSSAVMFEFFERAESISNPLCRILKTMFEKGAKFDNVGAIQEKLVSVIAQPESVSQLHEVIQLLSASGASKSVFEKILATSESALESVLHQDTTIAPEWHIAALGEVASLGFLPTARGLTALEATATNRVYIENGIHCPLPPSVRASAMVAFGKICLEKESIAKRAVSKFAAHLSREEHPVVRNNVLIVLGDLCVLYTGLVDQYLPWVTNCLSDPNDLIRYQSAVVVASLLAEDYIKFKGQIVFRLLYLLSDSNVKIKYFVESVFSRILFLRHSTSLKTLFAETVCALNGYMRHPQFQGAMGNRDFCLVGNQSRRREIYQFMLANVATTEQKFNSIVQLANSLLSAFVDEDVTNGQVQIPARETDPAGQVMIDTLYLLSCKELKLSSSVSREAEEDTEKKVFDAALQKKTIVDNLVPLLIQLNRLCESKRSPISRYVRECLRELMKDYREDISLILHADTQLAEELAWDLQQREAAAIETPGDALPERLEEAAAPEEKHSEGNSEANTAKAAPLVQQPEDIDDAEEVRSGIEEKYEPIDSDVDMRSDSSEKNEQKIAPKRRGRRANTSLVAERKRVKTVKEEDPPTRGSSRLARKKA